MEVPAERKQQIEDEERQRLAEDRYREQVRARLSADAGSSVPPHLPRASEPARRTSGQVWLGVLAVIIIAAIIVVNGNRTKVRASDDAMPAAVPVHESSVHYVPETQKIASGQIVVRPGGYVQYRFEITPEMRNARVMGRFGVSGGMGNDIEAVIATEDEFANWINGRQARVLYCSQGRKTTDAFNVTLAPGTYYLGFNNRFSVFSAKDVSLEVELIDLRMETY